MDEHRESQESRLRSIAKALTYRFTGTVTTMAVTLAVTGEPAVALAVGGIEPGVKIGVYYLHERAWQRVPPGTMRRLGSRLGRPFRLAWRAKRPVL